MTGTPPRMAAPSRNAERALRKSRSPPAGCHDSTCAPWSATSARAPSSERRETVGSPPWAALGAIGMRASYREVAVDAAARVLGCADEQHRLSGDGAARQ